jgi:hypothetical protein
MTEEQRTLSALYDLQEVVKEGTNFSKSLNELINELEKYIQEKHLIPLV